MERILAAYSIEYENGVIQTKNLISHKDFEEHIKPTKDQIHEFEVANKRKEADKLKFMLKVLYGGSWFTDQSPLYNAITTKMIQLLPHQGNHMVKITQL